MYVRDRRGDEGTPWTDSCRETEDRRRTPWDPFQGTETTWTGPEGSHRDQVRAPEESGVSEPCPALTGRETGARG